jgi:hypothetical protein
MSRDYSDREPTPATEQIQKAFELAEISMAPSDFDWLARFLDGGDGDENRRLLQFSVYGTPAEAIYIVLQVPAEQFGALAQQVLDGEFRVPFRISVLSMQYASPATVNVCVTWGPGGGGQV